MKPLPSLLDGDGSTLPGSIIRLKKGLFKGSQGCGELLEAVGKKPAGEKTFCPDDNPICGFFEGIPRFVSIEG